MQATADLLARLVVPDLRKRPDPAGCSFSTWESFSATAAFSLQTNLVVNGLPKALLIPGDGVDNLMRLGYAIRIVDEVAGLEPLSKVREARLS